MTEAKETSPKRYGFDIGSVTPDFISKLVTLYGESVGLNSRIERYVNDLSLGLDVDNILKDIQSQGYHERRLGSKIDYDSKFIIRSARKRHGIFYADFFPNLDTSQKTTSTALQTRAEEVREEFRNRVSEYLLDSGKGVEIEN